MNTTLLSWWSIWNRNQAVGAGQVVLAAKKVIDTPFIAINADDYYGKEGFKVIHRLQEAVIMNEKIVDNRFDFLKSISIFLIVGWHVAQHSSILGGGNGRLLSKA